MTHTKNECQQHWTLEIVPEHADRISVFKGLVDEIFVTMIPGKSVQASIEAMERVANEGFAPVPHLTARNFQTESDLNLFFSEVRRLQVKKVLILAGGHGQPAGPFSESMDVLRSEAFMGCGVETVAVAGHPEGNPDDSESWNSLEKKWKYFNEQNIKMQIVTQWSFSPEHINAYLNKLAEHGIDAPVSVGIAGPASLKTLLKFAKVCGVNAAATVVKKQGFSMGRLLVSNDPEKFVAGVVGSNRFHLYPFGGLEKCAKWLSGQVAAV